MAIFFEKSGIKRGFSKDKKPLYEKGLKNFLFQGE